MPESLVPHDATDDLACRRGQAGVAPTSSLTFTTAIEPESRQFDAYRAQCAPVVELLPSGETAAAGFPAQFEMWKLGSLVLRRIQTPAGRFLRRKDQARRDGLDHWVFNVLQSGEEHVASDRSDFRARAGVLSVFSLASANEVRRTQVDWVGLFVPRGMLPELDKALHPTARFEVDTAQGRLVAAHLRALSAELSTMTERDAPACVDSTLALLSSLQLGAAPLSEPDDPVLDRPRLARIRDLIDRHLGSWSLNTDRLARLAGLSRSSLYRLFEPHGGVARYIHLRRLQRAHALIEGSTYRKVGDVAAELCFADASVFARAFRKEFGYSPTELRQRAWCTAAAPSQPTPPLEQGGAWGMLR